MEITKKEFIQALCDNGTVFTYAEAKELPLIAVIGNGKARVRHVAHKRSSHLEFSDGSRLYFDSFAKRKYYKFSATYMMEISEIGLPYNKYLFYTIAE